MEQIYIDFVVYSSDLSDDYNWPHLQIFSDSKSLLKLSKLEHLDLSLNNFDMDILKTLGSLPALKSLSLARNHMEGMLSDQGMCN